MIDISVVMPTYQRPRELRRALMALNEQVTEFVFEVIVVDDGSSAEMTGVVESISPGFPCRVLWQPRCGIRPAAARNLGVRSAQGETVLFLDDDVVGTADLIQAHGVRQRSQRDLVLVGQRVAVPFSSWKNSLHAMVSWLQRQARANDPRSLAFKEGAWLKYPWAFVATCHLSMPRDALCEVECFDENYVGWGFEDTDLGYRLFRAGKVFDYLDTPPVMHLEDCEQSQLGQVAEIGIPFSRICGYLSNGNRFVNKYPDDSFVACLVAAHRVERLMANPRALIQSHPALFRCGESVRDVAFEILSVTRNRPSVEQHAGTTASSILDDSSFIGSLAASSAPSVLSLSTPYSESDATADCFANVLAQIDIKSITIPVSCLLGNAFHLSEID